MSEQGWQDFLAAEGVEDWVVLHGGATAVFRVRSLGEAAQLAEAVSHIPGLEGSGALLTIADDRLTVRLSRGVFRLERSHVDLAGDNAIDPLGHGSTVWMQELDTAKPLRHAMHVDVSVAREHAEARVAAALEAGGHVVDDADAPAGWILADRAGNRVCIAAWPDGSLPAAPAVQQ